MNKFYNSLFIYLFIYLLLYSKVQNQHYFLFYFDISSVFTKNIRETQHVSNNIKNLPQTDTIKSRDISKKMRLGKRIYWTKEHNWNWNKLEDRPNVLAVNQLTNSEYSQRFKKHQILYFNKLHCSIHPFARLDNLWIFFHLSKSIVNVECV